MATNRSAKMKTFMGMPLDTFAALQQAPCGQCGTKAPAEGNLPQRDRSVWCTPCAKAANDADAKPCGSCGTKATRIMGSGPDETPLCGKCATAARKGLTRSLFEPAIPMTHSNILAAAGAR
jgi:hypothetical protein